MSRQGEVLHHIVFKELENRYPIIIIWIIQFSLTGKLKGQFNVTGVRIPINGGIGASQGILIGLQVHWGHVCLLAGKTHVLKLRVTNHPNFSVRNGDLLHQTQEFLLKGSDERPGIVKTLGMTDNHR